ncbi:hypothetical protein BaRGS_00007583 [Batillaria attramentaria]|uniref:Parathion hydrolase-related protein n=1 Tax=Batillaria attramentaria TaxID=370345 RepID=A0ABD0LNN7_9CAEN
MSERKGMIQTVQGLIDPGALGATLTHEHLALQADCFFVPPADSNDEPKTKLPFAMENLGWIRQNPYSHKPNLSLQGEHDAILHEVKSYKEIGGGCIVENSTIGLHRDVQFLRRLSEATGVHIIAGTGFYVDGFQTESTRQLTEEAMAALTRENITSGADGTEICCGVIGEVGCTWPLTDFEKRSLRSAAMVQTELGSPVIIHPGRSPKAPEEIMHIFLEAGGQAYKTVMSHLDRTFFSTNQLLEFAKFGCYCEYDLFGIETSHYQLWQEADMPSDASRIAFIRSLVDAGLEDHVLVSHDIHTKHRLKKYGGHGYTHILENIVPKMRQRGISDETITKILRMNPQKWLAFTK